MDILKLEIPRDVLTVIRELLANELDPAGWSGLYDGMDLRDWGDASRAYRLACAYKIIIEQIGEAD